MISEREIAALKLAIAERDAQEAASAQIRRIAVRAGIMGSHGTQVPMHKLEAFASLLLDEENEACAQVCDRFQERGVGMQPAECAGAIRMRRKHEVA
jgi:hypothetical protein